MARAVLVTGDSSSTLPVFDAPSDGELTNAIVRAYHDSGVVILENFVDVAACRRLQARANELIDRFDPAEVRSVFSTTEQTQLDDRYFIESGDKIRFFLEADAFDEQGELRQSKENSLNKMGHAMHDLDPVFEEFSHSVALDNIARGLGVKDPGVIQSMYIFKPPRIGGEVVFHQDSTYIYTEPESCIGFWFAVEDATLENGCMHFIPGGHAGPLRERNKRTGEYSLATEVLDTTPWDESKTLPAEAKAGTLVVFNGRAPHMSPPNTSDKSRQAYTLHVIDKACDYPASNWLQRSADLPLRGFV
ncbi:MAG: phytanoyl-CoA dioxygenase family protein [Gammaproteobacteria bacterium]|nr:phytanoyl-CoA dioxygenase family protein [Gammaproteobacteria bacterium]